MRCLDSTCAVEHPLFTTSARHHHQFADAVRASRTAWCHEGDPPPVVGDPRRFGLHDTDAMRCVHRFSGHRIEIDGPHVCDVVRLPSRDKHKPTS